MRSPAAIPCQSAPSCNPTQVRQAVFSFVRQPTAAGQCVRAATVAACGGLGRASVIPLPKYASHAQQPQHSRRRGIVLRAAESSDPTRSLKETAALDELIDMLLSCRTQQEIAQLVAENIFSFDPKFWLRVATRNDTATSGADKERLQVMADAVMLLVNAMVKKTEAQLEGSSKILQEILAAAADEKGDWYLPLTEEQVTRVRAALDRHADSLDEALLSNAFAWIKKSGEDRFDGMVKLIQKVLQLYAGRALRTSETAGVEGALNQIIFAEEDKWAGLIRASAQSGDINEASFMEALQRRMESTVLGLQSGSYAQRVQAEYLKEVEARGKSVFKQLASSSVRASKSQ